jgi:hypothetical protein
MSGYPAGDQGLESSLDMSDNFISKPMTPAELGRIVRKVLEA